MIAIGGEADIIEGMNSMTTRKIALAATTALAGTLLISGGAWAQSTGTQTVEEVVVTAQRTATVDGAIIAEKNPKSRSTITQEYIQTQNPGQSVIQTINLLPGVNFVNNDPFGSSGGNVRIRSFDGNRISNKTQCNSFSMVQYWRMSLAKLLTSGGRFDTK